jgi:pimeloyl-ACP methyl ester carboxylesterase
VRLHFTVHGRDDAPQTLVMLHGEGSVAEEFEISGIVKMAAERYRVVVFDRPGYGHSDRPRGRAWGPNEQADLFAAAFTRLGLKEPVVLGHSWGAVVALAMGLRHPDAVGSLVLGSGYYFPTVRPSMPMMSLPAVPLLGTLMRHTVSPLLSRLVWGPMVRRLFSPAPTTDAFRTGFPVWQALRPSQLRASAAEAASLIPAVAKMRHDYERLSVPAVLIAGAGDRFVNTRWHSARLHERLPNSWLRIVEGAGHMVHHAAPAQMMAAIDQAAGMVWDRSLKLRPPTGLKTGETQPQVPVPVVPCPR